MSALFNISNVPFPLKTLLRALIVLCFALPGVAGAYEYKLQYTPNAGARGLTVAGYEFSGKNVIGNCSYYTVHSGSGRGGGYKTITTHYDQTCTWDVYGNLLTVATGAPIVPTPLYVNGTQTVYATDSSGDSTGNDTAIEGGFVNTIGAHYSWLTSNAYTVLPQALYTFTASLKSDGDLPLIVAGANVSALAAPAVINGAFCVSGSGATSTCKFNLTYDPTKLCSASGLAYDTLTLRVTTNSPQTTDFVQNYTITLLPINSGENCGGPD